MTRIYTFFDAKLQKILLTQYIFEKNSFFCYNYCYFFMLYEHFLNTFLLQ